MSSRPIAIELLPIVVTTPRPGHLTDLPERAYSPGDLAVARAADIQAGDLIVAEFPGATSPFRWTRPLARPSYFGMAYLALPAPFNPGCGCGVCDPGGAPELMVLLHPSPAPWPEVCDPWERRDLVLYVPAAKLC
jgi:hypothetical protein